MRVSVLGPLMVEESGRALRVGGARQKALVTYLALRRNQTVPAERLVTDLWGEDSPPDSTNAVQVVVSRLRKVLPVGRLVTDAGGYVLRLQPTELDVTQFEGALDAGRAALARNDPHEAAGVLRRALALWRGPALLDVRYQPFAQADIARLEELQLTCREAAIEADLRTGRAAELVPELRQLVDEHPLRERPRGQLMLALYRCGRQTEALATYREARALLATELGVEPSPGLADLHAAILRHDLSLESTPATESVQVAAPSRRLVTVLWVDTAGTPSPAGLDLEAVHLRGHRVRDDLTTIVERYGGRLLAGPGPSLQGVFGSSAVHEDDAHRACLAAVEARRTLQAEPDAVLGPPAAARLTCRMGIATAEALIAGTTPSDIVSESADLARTLAESAEPGEILVSEATFRLAEGALDVVAAGPGRHRLRSATFGARTLPVNLDTPLIGRAVELHRLDDALRDAEHAGSTRLVTVLGEAGIGKSRLVHEFAARAGDRASVLVGRCLPYGEAVTFWPLRDIVLQAAGGGLSPGQIEHLLTAEPDAVVIASRLTRVFGVGEPGTADAAEVFWATRRLLEALGRDRPLVVVLEDLHWADAAFLDLVESIAAQPPRVQLLVVCVARPDLLDRRTTWRAASPEMLALEPLGPGEAEDLLGALIPDAVGPSDGDRTRLLDAASGNPLYLEQLIAWWRERPDASGASFPLTVQALLAARLDRLGPAEQALLACASVLGREFDHRWVVSLLPEQARPAVRRHLAALTAKGLVQPRASGHRFRHVLIQQAAYRAIPKMRRAELHEQVAEAMQASRGGQGTQWTEVLAHHLEQATAFRRELQQHEQAAALARRAATQLRAAGEASLALGNAAAAERHFARAAALVTEDDDSRAEVLTSLGTAQLEAGKLAEAAATLRAAGDLAGPSGNLRLYAHTRAQALAVTMHVNPGRAAALVGPYLAGLTATFTQCGDDEGLSLVWHLRAMLSWQAARAADAETSWECAAVHARHTGDQRQLAWTLAWLASAALWGPAPAAQGIARCRGYLAEPALTPTCRALVQLHVAGLHAMQDDLPAARRLLAEGAAVLDDIGGGLPLAVTEPAAFVDLLDGDAAAAERNLRTACDELSRMGERDQLATAAAFLARALVLQGPHRHVEAEQWVTVSRQASGDEDPSARMVGLGVQARILADRGTVEDAVRLAREAVASGARTDFLNQHADALVDLSHVLARADDDDGARKALRRAERLYAHKGNLIALANLAGIQPH